MYSRKFDGRQYAQPAVPPDYSGVAYRPDTARPVQNSTTDDRDRRARRALYFNVPSDDLPAGHSGGNFADQTREASVPALKGEATGRRSGSHSDERSSALDGILTKLRGYRFSMEDLVLAGIFLLLLREDADSDILLLLGFLLFAGLT